MSKVCIIVPHCDDEILGFGGAIQHHKSKGDEVDVLIVRNPYIDNRSMERRGASSKCALTLKYHLKLANIREDEFILQRSIINIVDKHICEANPDILYTVSGDDSHQDHKILFQIINTITRVTNKRLHIKQIYCGEVPSSTGNSFGSSQFQPNFYLPLTKDMIKQKIELFSMFKEEVNKFPHPRSAEGIRTFAKFRGMQCGSEYAEAYNCIKYVV